ncbi:MAG: type I DNA topoisomerase [Chlamydiae bacterium CG10_big_fil_rev_8_21_14_0_10_35_9]|nr:MAG: type I DNA topoisomerase [Chlamydiae bacterium CG10_big_fil_rev_8_21_14_0_10_35_9]
MGKALIIVESPTKIKTLKKFLGSKFLFESSLGHIRDLPQKDFGIDIEHDFEPTYVTMPDKKDVIKKLKDAAKKVDTIYLSPDPDREGEAIAWHIASILPKNANIKRMVFHSITKKAVQDALENPREINQNLVNAQQARRLLDRMVGYKISPILTRKVKRGKNGTSAGRVQSVALKLVVDREKEINAFKPVEFWTVKATLHPEDTEKSFEATVINVDGKKVEKEKGEQKNVFLIPDEKTATGLKKRLESNPFAISEIERKEKKRNPVPPFITSTLQQEASRHYGFAVARTMSIAQSLYEGIDMGKEGTEGLITYMRTDSVQVAGEAISSAREHIKSTYGKDFLPEKPKQYTSKKSAQEAHEAIRPTNLDHPPELIKPYLNEDQYKLYLLIWRRFVASQMNPAVYDTVSVDVTCDNIILRANGSILKFQGFLAAYQEKFDKDDAEAIIEGAPLPEIEEGQKLELEKVTTQQSYTKPPPRFTEASLVKELEKSGIGRPSTYATIMNKIQSREYTVKENQALKPTELGQVIAQMLEENFKTIMDVGFTASMEDQLEMIAEDEKDWKELLRDFWKDFEPMVEKAEKEATVPKLMTDIDCPKCGHKLQKVWSRNKYFYGCSNYPDCDFTAPIEALNFKKEDYAEDFDWDQKCPICGSDMQLRHGKFGPFLGCSRYPDCSGIVNIPKKGEKVENMQDMPDCPAIGCDGKIVSRKSRYGKTFYSCSNFPDCDVIVNDLNDLSSKYKDHPKTPYKKPKRGKSSTGKKGKLLQLSKELADVVGAKELTRGDIIKKMWEYIKSHNCQDPNNKRNIVPDDKLAKVFGSKEPIDMMKLAGIIKPHIK